MPTVRDRSGDFLNSVDSVGIHSWASAIPAHRQMIRQSLRKNYPHICTEVSDDNSLICVDARPLPNPGDERDLRGHLGTYPKNLEFTLETKEWRNLWERLARTVHKALRSAADGERLVILTFCKGGKHRGHMLRFLLKRVLEELYDIECEVLDCSPQ